MDSTQQIGLLVFALAVSGLVFWIVKTVQSKNAEAEKYRKRSIDMQRKQTEQYKKLQAKVAHVEKKARRQAERFTKLAACPKGSGIKEKYCTCSGDKCTCGDAGSKAKEAYAAPVGGMIPVRPMVNMVAGAVGKAKQLRAEQALRGAAAGLPQPAGGMLGKEPILTAGGKETFKPNRGMY